MARHSMGTKSKVDTAQFEKVQNFQESEQEEYERKKKIAYSLVGIVVIISLGVIVALVTWFLLKDPPPANSGLPMSFSIGNQSNITLDIPANGHMRITVRLPANNYNKSAVLHVGTSIGDVISVRKCGTEADCYNVSSKDNNAYKLKLSYTPYEEEPDFICASVEWTGSLDSEIQDCIELGTSSWYGGGLLFEQHWPMSLDKPLTPFLSADILQKPTDYGSVLEPYWLSTDGMALIVKWDAKDQPLHHSWNSSGDGKLCIMSRYRNSPFKPLSKKDLKLEYSLCAGRDIAHVHKSVLNHRNPWPKPKSIPDQKLFEKPIWSTWVSYKHNISQTSLMEFVNTIREKNFTASNIEIDDGYQVYYGDFSFNSTKFPDPNSAIKTINGYGFNVTVWVYPFINYNSHAIHEALKKKYLVMAENGKVPAMTWWWPDEASKLAGLLDFTNPDAADWYFKRLQKFRTDYGIHSFKFDAGENNWTPSCHKLHKPEVSSDVYGKVYAEKVAENIGNGLEVRIGLHTQQLPVFVRMLDKDSVVGYENGLKTLIPTAFVFGILGYPFVLPDMIGGNAYKNSTEPNAIFGILEDQYPSEELFLRWVAATVFMPSIQFSITPWSYDQRSGSTTCVDKTRKLLDLRKPYENLYLELARNATKTGYPIIRPLWWNDASNPATWNIDDQFLVGDDLMVAPLLDVPSNLHRSIYFPSGVWKDILTKEIFYSNQTENPATRKVELDEIRVFVRVN